MTLQQSQSEIYRLHPADLNSKNKSILDEGSINVPRRSRIIDVAGIEDSDLRNSSIISNNQPTSVMPKYNYIKNKQDELPRL